MAILPVAVPDYLAFPSFPLKRELKRGCIFGYHSVGQEAIYRMI